MPKVSTPQVSGALGRRHFLGLAGAATVVGAVGTLGTEVPAEASRPLGDVFTLGVASGDPHPDGVVLWTRLAPEPLAADGKGGMPDKRVAVRWEVAEDPRFGKVVRRGVEHAVPAWGHSVHAEVRGLRPDREYWYRFAVGHQLSPVGRTRTAPAAYRRLNELTFAFASCQAYHEGFFTAYRHMAQDDLDLVVHLGDYIYEGNSQGTIGRGHLPVAETFSLADYRVRYGQYKSDPDLQAAHAAAPWVVAPDDHDVENNWAGDISQLDNEPDQDPAVFRQRRAAAYQAYYENLPLRRTSMPRGPEMQVFRRLTFGNLLQLNVLDTRRFRTDQLECVRGCDDRFDPARTMLGAEQERWLLDGLGRSDARWNALGNQIFAFEADHDAGPSERFGMDTWDGYAAARQRLFDGVVERRVDNFVMITGDAHRSVAADLKLNFADPSSRTVGTEFLGTSISSGGNGTDTDALGHTWLAENPHMRFHNSQRGYQRCVVTPTHWRTDYRVVPNVTTPGGPVITRASVTVESGRPGVAEVSN
ncbi:Alkaline phosphatase [Kribbella flavida DSM 17836]|uniref:Alkaline phosphatase n=1 Tax=Kribbella flavida (strain DSM 17836 / JCM 10339 / NBRC 14399) TaxID=479435 RepID=D2PUD2_KRIFD|nr:alkaline phosphatase D family protein [Kribbella flavida]ADB35183.1 Alkaline phosphatase [Kribbella flavida DSM 17836]